MSVAVLLENFVAASRRMEEEEAAEKAAVRKMMSQFKNPMEPLLAKLASSFVDDADLKEKLNTVYNVRELPPTLLFIPDSFSSAVPCSFARNMLFPLSPALYSSFTYVSTLPKCSNRRNVSDCLVPCSLNATLPTPYDRAALNILSLRRGSRTASRKACLLSTLRRQPHTQPAPLTQTPLQLLRFPPQRD